jgi:hypothetical protein
LLLSSFSPFLVFTATISFPYMSFHGACSVTVDSF